VMNKHGRALVPGAEITAPGRFGPARVRAVPVQILGCEIQPVLPVVWCARP
jgi:hypothetical protein